MSNGIQIAEQPYLEVTNRAIQYNLVGDKILRYFVKRYDGKIGEVSKQDFQQYRTNPFFDKLIINWYIRGTRDFVQTQNIKELRSAETVITGIQRLVVNPLQLYQGET
jgi:hypothetical protein